MKEVRYKKDWFERLLDTIRFFFEVMLLIILIGIFGSILLLIIKAYYLNI